MKLDEIVAWYQKKIGTYDKQQWEKTVEQKILDGFNSVTLKNAKLKTDLIDVDLVRGSTFPKAKPKQTLVTVIRLAVLRYFFLPLYAQWWVKQTSPNTFAILLLMYITQMITWAVYTFNVHPLSTATVDAVNNATRITGAHDAAGSVGGVKQTEEHIVSLSDLLIPMALSLMLSLIHSQIVATNTASGTKTKRRRFSNSTLNAKAHREPRVRRRKKLVRARSQELADTAAQQPQAQQPSQQPPRKLSAIKKLQTTKAAINLPQEATAVASVPANQSANNAANANEHCNNLEVFHNTISTVSVIRRNACSPYAAAKLKLDLNGATKSAVIATLIAGTGTGNTDGAAGSSTDCVTDNNSTSSSSLMHKKRNVNWHSPIHNFACAASTQEKQQQTSPQSLSSASASASASAATTTTTSETNSPNNAVDGALARCLPTAGGSSGSGSRSPNKTVRIDDCVQEFYDDLIRRTDRLALRPPGTEGAAASSSAGEESAHSAHMVRRNNCEDDGFESLNGKSSSGEETHPPLTPAILPEENNLRLRLNANADRGKRVEETGGQQGESKAGALYRHKLQRTVDELENRPLSACDVRPQMRKIAAHSTADVSSGETDEEGDDGETISSPASLGNVSNYNECTTSATEWLGVTTNSEECSYSSELENSDYKNNHMSDEDAYDLDFTPTTILNPHGTSDRISCTVWEQREIKKAQLSVLEISSCIIERVESMPETNDYIYIGLCFSFILSLIPSFCRLCEVTIEDSNASEINYFDLPMLLWEKASFSFSTIFRFAFGYTQWERTVLVISFMQRLCLTMIVFIIFAVAERTFKQRFLYAKLFSHLTSSRRARKSNLPHFRLSKVRNIKTWLSVRSYLKKRGPQRSVDIIVSAAFVVTLLLLAFLSVEWLKDSVHLHSHLNLEALMWSTTIGIFLVRFMTLGNKIHHKYRSVSVLITEQINLYLQIEQKPKKKDELMVSNSVLKLAADLLKELETPFKISGLSANPYLFTTVKVVILSALSGVLSEMLGFKLKLHKIKIK